MPPDAAGLAARVVPTILGIAYDGGSSFSRGAAAGPAAIRSALASDATNMWSEDGRDISVHLQDAGDVVMEQGVFELDAIESAVAKLLSEGRTPIALGGDHSVTLPVLRAMRRLRGGFDVLHIDAHPDLYPDFAGQLYSHASPFARALEEELLERLVQVGVRTVTDVQRAQMNRFGVEVIDMKAWRSGVRPSLEEPLYLSIDLDGIDPAYAPGVIHREPGGLTSSEVIGILQSLRGRVIGADIVELAPANDPAKITAPLAAKLVKEVAAAMLRTP